MGRRVAANLGAALLGVVLSLAFLEVALKIHNPIVQTVKGEEVVLRTNYDEIRKNTRILGVKPESYIHQNSVGFRGADPPADLADRLSIITVGGSTTRSAEQSDDRTWPALLGDAVANCFDHTWINNAGFEGHTSFAHIKLIRDYITKLHPKIVVLLIGANELYVDNLSPDANTQSRDVVTIEQLKHSIANSSWLKRFIISISNHSEVGALSLTLYRSIRAWKFGLTSAGYWTEGDAMPHDAEVGLASARNNQPEYAERLRLIIRLLRDGQTIPVLMTQPAVGGIGRDPTTGKDLSRMWYGQFFNDVFEIYNDTMRQVAQSGNICLIDLAYTMPKDTKYYFDPMHYTDAGAKKLAELVTREFLPYLEQEFPSYNNGTCRILSTNPG